MQFIDKISDFADAAPDGQGKRGAVEAQLMREEYEAALREVEEASAKCQQSGDGPGRAAALQASATVKQVTGKLAEAQTLAEEALAAFRVFNGVKGEAMSLHTLARISLDRNKLDEAETNASEAKAKFQDAQCKEGEGATLITMAKVLLSKGELDNALQSANDAEALFKGIGGKEGEAAALIAKSMVNLAGGEYAEATKLAQAATSACQQSSHPASKYREGDALLLMSSAALAQQAGQEGLEKAQAALALLSGLGGSRGKAMALQAISAANLELFNLEEALKAIDEAVALGVKEKQLQASLLSTAARVYRSRLWKDGGEMPDLSFADMALQKAKDAAAVYGELGQDRLVAIEKLELAQMHMECGNNSEALQEATSAQETFAKAGDKRGEAVALLTTSELHYNKGDNQTALGHAQMAQRSFKEVGADDLATQAGAVIKFLEVQMQPKKKKSDPPKVLPEKPQEGQIKNSTYSQIVRTRICTPETEPLCFDMQNILYMGLILGVNIPFLPDPTGQAGAAPPPPPKPRAAPGKASAASAPPSQQLLEARRRQETRAAEAAAELEEAPKKAPTYAVVGNDVLGGRARDTSEALHEKMLELAKRGDIPVTNPDRRATLMLRKPTFHGPVEWREAVQQGYLHPKLPAPRGLKWKSLTVGWKLVPQSGAAAETMEPIHLAAGSRARDEPLSGIPLLACK